ncbi:hypothetical protein LL037_10460 [Clostridium estertheticum]|uniref:hypothetical protein n=1 Tax=Clostridium estertheticum TaxID=238834 RepID=UPI00209AF44B|nr:hypothetical protein LL037_10460 [Clostridium estertheticum]
MTIPNTNKVYPRSNDYQTIYLKNVITRDNIKVGDYTIYNDYYNDPRDFEKNNVLYQYPVNNDKLIIGKFCSISCKAKFLMTSGNHTMKSLSTYTFPIFYEEWGLDVGHITDAWDNKGDIVIGNDVWIGYDAIIMSGVKIGGVEKMTHQPTEKVTDAIASAMDYNLEAQKGVTFPANFAMIANRYFHEYRNIKKEMGMCAVNAHYNALLTPNAHMHKSIDILSCLFPASPRICVTISKI